MNHGKDWSKPWKNSCRVVAEHLQKVTADGRSTLLCAWVLSLALASALRKYGESIAKLLQMRCRMTLEARQSYFETMANTLQITGEPIAKSDFRRFGLPVKLAHRSADLTNKRQMKPVSEPMLATVWQPQIF
jgi:hypothetical protein